MSTARAAESTDAPRVTVSPRSRRHKQTLAGAPPEVDGEIGCVDRDDGHLGTAVAQDDDARIREVDPPIPIPNALMANGLELIGEEVLAHERSLLDPGEQPVDGDAANLLEEEYGVSIPESALTRTLSSAVLAARTRWKWSRPRTYP